MDKRDSFFTPQQELAHRGFNAVVSARGPREKIGIAATHGAGGQPHGGGRQIHGLKDDPHVFQGESVGDRFILPRRPREPGGENDEDLQTLRRNAGGCRRVGQERFDVPSRPAQKLAELRESTRKKLNELLKDPQLAKWKEMTGEPFKGELTFYDPADTTTK